MTMTPANDGGAAFPTPYTMRDGDHYSTEYEGGMSLRDYFAAKAMQAIIAHPHGHAGNWPLAASDAYAAADAMLAQRSKK